MPVLRVQELLAELGYLPLNVDVKKGQPLLSEEPKRAAMVSTAALPAGFTWRYPSSPFSLKSLWSPDQYTVMTQGAVMEFEAAVGLSSDGVVGPAVWAALTSAVAGRHLDKAPYDYLVVSESAPESLVVWQGGKPIYQTPRQYRCPGGRHPVRDVARLRPLRHHDDGRHRPRRLPLQRVRHTRGWPTSWAATPCMAIGAPTTATPRAMVA